LRDASASRTGPSAVRYRPAGTADPAILRSRVPGVDAVVRRWLPSNGEC